MASDLVQLQQQAMELWARPEVRKWGTVVGGGLLALYGLRQRSLPGVLLVAAGGTLLWKGLQMGACCAALPDTTTEVPGPTVEDPVDESSWESFPASDAPGTY